MVLALTVSLINCPFVSITILISVLTDARVERCLKIYCIPRSSLPQEVGVNKCDPKINKLATVLLSYL